MKHPPYHLRPNKAVDRFLLIEILTRLKSNSMYNLKEYTYYGLGGPFLEDCRLLHHYHPEIKLVSIEGDEETFKRQEFHRFCTNLSMTNQTMGDFLGSFSEWDRAIFWLDYTNLRYAHFEEFMTVLERVATNSVVKITLPVRPPLRPNGRNDEAEVKRFEAEYGKLFPDRARISDLKRDETFRILIYRMIQIAAQQALPADCGNTFQLINSAHYVDGTQMLSVTGIVCPIEHVDTTRDCFNNWDFSNLEWEDPHKIDLPHLSIKERLKLEKLLPLKGTSVEEFADGLGYRIDDGHEKSLAQLRQYTYFYRYYPFFAKMTM